MPITAPYGAPDAGRSEPEAARDGGEREPEMADGNVAEESLDEQPCCFAAVTRM